MAQNIIIKLDLDDKEAQKSFVELEKNANNSINSIDKNLKQNLDNTLNIRIKNSVEDFSSSMKKSLDFTEPTNVFKAALAGIGVSIAAVTANSTDLKNTLSGVATAVLKDKSFIGFNVILMAISSSLSLLGESLKDAESSFLKFTSIVTLATAGILGGLTAIVIKGVSILSDFGKSLSEKFTAFFQQTSDIFIKTTSDIEILNAVINTVNRSAEKSAGSYSDWDKQINNLSESLNINIDSLRKSSQEIALVGSQLKLSSSQMLDLLKISSEYAKINKKDVFDVTVAITGALQGNSQAVQALGIKLSQASVMQYAYTKGLTTNFNKLSENELVQIRFNKLLSQYSEIAGLGAVAANTLADQAARYEVNLKRVSSELGKGASLIEDNNLLYFLMNKVISNINNTVLNTAGFLGALGSRVLNIGATILGLSFKIYALIKAFKILDIILSSDTSQKLFSKNIFLMGDSLNGLISKFAGVKVEIKSLNDLLYIVGLTVIKVFKGNFSPLSGLFKPITDAISILITKFRNLIPVLIPVLVPFAKIGLVVGVVSGAIYTLYKAFEELENRTQVFTNTWKILLEAISSSVSIFQPVFDFFTRIKNSLVDLAMAGFGMIIFSIAKAFGMITQLIQSNPFGVFSDETISKISAVNQKLADFTGNLKSVAYDITKLPQDASRSIAGAFDEAEVNIEQLVNDLNSIRDSLRNVGLTDKEIILRDQAEQLEILRLSFENKLLLEQEYNNLKLKVNQDTQEKLNDLLKKSEQEKQNTLAQSNRIIQQALGNAISQGIQRSIEALAKGKSVFADFASWIIGLFGDLAIQLGQFYIADGLAKLFLLKANPAAQITAGASLIALGSILKSFFAGGIGGGASMSSTAQIGAQPAPGQFTTPQADLASPDRIDEERQAPKTNVSITVQGSLVQQEELGEFITRTLNESFGKQGITLTDARFA